jgi:hypothetical protein
MLRLASSKYIIIAMIAMMNVNSEFIFAINSATNWKIDELKTGGVLSFSPASTSLDMTQPAHNINPVETRHLSETMTRTDDVVIYAADMQTQHNVSDDKDKAITSQLKHCVINDIINDENQYDVSNQFFEMHSGSRDFVTNHGYRDELILHLEKCNGTVEIHCFLCSSSCNYDNKDTAQFPKGIILNCEAMEIISPYNTECSQIVVQYNSEDNGTESDMGTMNVQCTSDHNGPRPIVEAIIQKEIFECVSIKKLKRQLLQ